MTKHEIKQQILALEAEQRQGLQMIEQGRAVAMQAEGALRLARLWLGKMERAEDDARTRIEVNGCLATEATSQD